MVRPAGYQEASSCEGLLLRMERRGQNPRHQRGDCGQSVRMSS